MIAFDPTEVGLLADGKEPEGNNYRRQVYADKVVFGPAQPSGWGTVEALFVTDGVKRYPVTIERVLTRPGTTLTVDLTVELV